MLSNHVWRLCQVTAPLILAESEDCSFPQVLNVWTTVVEATQKDSQDEDTRFLANKNRQVY